MHMHDLETAKNRLRKKGLTLSIAKKGEIVFEANSHGISGFLEAIENLGLKLEDASVADRVTGKAIALLSVYAKVKAVYAITLSERAKTVFEENAVYHEWGNLVKNILGANKAGICPFEELAMEISNPNDAYRRLKALQNSLKHGR